MEELKKEGLKIDPAGELREIETGERYVIRKIAHRDKVAGLISEYIKEVLVQKYGMEKRILDGSGADGDDIKVPPLPVYMSQGLLTNDKPLIVLIQGAGEGRFGQWSPQRCITQDLEEGSMLPYVERATSLGYQVLIANPDVRAVEALNKGQGMEYTTLKRATFKRHLIQLWEEYISKCPAKKIVFVAHSYGGVGVLHLLQEKTSEVVAKVTQIAFTDSVHKITDFRLDATALKFLQERCVNFKQSEARAGTKLDGDKIQGCNNYSAGTEDHEYTSQAAMEAVFEHFGHGNKILWIAGGGAAAALLLLGIGLVLYKKKSS